MTSTSDSKQLPQGFDRLDLTPEHFHAFYSVFMGLRFPLDVAEVLDLRYLINHTVDEYVEPPLTPDYRDFRELIEKALDSLGIENPRHRERLLKAIAMVRQLYVTHSLASRDAEKQLRALLDEGETAHQRAVRSGLMYLFAGVVSVAAWFVASPVVWLAKVLTLLCAIQCWKYLRALPRIDQQAETTRLQLGETLRQRVNMVDWKILIQKLALVLGFVKPKDVEVFKLLTDTQEIRAIDGQHH